MQTTLEHPQAARGSTSRLAFWAGCVISALPVLMLLMGVTMAFRRPPMVMDGMAKFGYPSSLILPLGIVELACTILYVIPQTAVLGAILLTGYFGGAVATHVRIGDPGYPMAIIMGILVWLGLFLREPRLRELMPLRR